MKIAEDLQADCVERDGSRIGEIYHVRRNRARGTILTPVARYFAWRPPYVENVNPHWRVDCYVRRHKLAPNARDVAIALRTALLTHGLCEEPIWISWYSSEELAGEALGDVFDLG